jgi:hypothetical protein
MHIYVQASPASLWEWLTCETSVGGNSLFVAFIDSESVAIAILWRLSTPTVGVDSIASAFKVTSGATVPTYACSVSILREAPCIVPSTPRNVIRATPFSNEAMHDQN